MAEGESGKESVEARRERESAELRERLDAEAKKRELERKKEIFRRKLEIAKAGVKSSDDGRPGEAIRSFLHYIRIVEEWKGVGEGALEPKHFDMKKDIGELLLLSGIFWDLVKLYDKAAKKEKEFRHFLDKYVIFNKGMKYEPIASESLRKYISLDKARHRSDFKAAYRRLSNTRCFIATSLVDLIEGDTLGQLRAFRDDKLKAHFTGRLMVSLYERVSPGAVLLLDRAPAPLRKGVAAALDRLAKRLALNASISARE